MKNKLMKLRGKITVIMMNMITCFLMAQNYVYAGGIGSSKLFTGTKRYEDTIDWIVFCDWNCNDYL